MGFWILGICLFIAFAVVFLLLAPRPTAAGALLEEAVRPIRATDVPAWRNALDVDFLAKPFTFVRSLVAIEPNPDLVRRLMLAGYRRPAHADIFLGSKLAIPATLGVLIALFISTNTIIFFLAAVAVGFFVPDFWLGWAI